MSQEGSSLGVIREQQYKLALGVFVRACVRACVRLCVCVYQVSIPGVSRVPGECLLWIMCVPYLGMILYDR